MKIQSSDILPFSSHSLNKYRYCPRKFFYYKSKLPSTFIYMRSRHAGLFVHEFIKNVFDSDWVDEEDNDTLQINMASLFNEKWDKSPVRYMKPRIQKCLKHFTEFLIKNRKILLGPNVFSEQNFESDRWRGIIDLYNEDRGIIIDWKSGSGDSLTNDMKIQGSLYVQIKKEEELPIKKVFFVMLQHGRVIEHDINNNTLLKTIISKINEDIKVQKWKRNMTKWCRNCEYHIRCFSDLDGRSLWNGLIKRNLRKYKNVADITSS